MDPFIQAIIATFASYGMTGLTLDTVGPYMSAYGSATPAGAQKTIAVMSAIYQGCSAAFPGDTASIAGAFARLVSDGAKCPNQLATWQANGKLTGIATAVAKAPGSGSICDYIVEVPAPGGGGSGGSSGITGNAAVDAILAALPPGVATSLGGMLPAATVAVPIISQIAQTVCGSATLCQNAIPILTAGSQFPDLLQWAFQQGKLIQAVQDAMSSGKPLPDVIAAQQGKPPVTGGGTVAASSSMTVPLVVAGLGVAGVLYLLATRKPVRRSYVKVK